MAVVNNTMVRYPQAWTPGREYFLPYGLNKGLSSSFPEGYPDRNEMDGG